MFINSRIQPIRLWHVVITLNKQNEENLNSFATAAGMLPFIGFQVGLPISTAFCKAVDGKRLVPISS